MSSGDVCDEGGWLDACLDRVKRARVTVFGDLCLDAYWHLDTVEQEVSIETGKLVHRVARSEYSAGGAGNVIANLKDLGVGRVYAVGLVGRDMFGMQLREVLSDEWIDLKGVLDIQGDWTTAVYSKPLMDGVELNRIDFGGFNRLAEETRDALMEMLARTVGESDVCILNQQIPGGVLDEAMIGRVNELIDSCVGCRFIVDSRHRAGQFRGAMLKVNAHEAAGLCGEEVGLGERIELERVVMYGQRLAEESGEGVFVTMGESGLVVVEEGEVEIIRGLEVSGEIDPVGAGDTVVAGLAGVVGSGGSLVEAGRVANMAACVTVRKLYTTGTAQPGEILEVGRNAACVYEPEVAEDVERAVYLEGTRVELVGACLDCGKAGVEGGVTDVVFDHDGTITTFRAGWEAAMEEVMMDAVLGDRIDYFDEGILETVQGRVRELIGRTTGVQTIVQMGELLDLIREFGFAGQEDVLGAGEYKARYKRAMEAFAGPRREGVVSGEVAAERYLVKGVVELLELLRGQGVRRHLASGSDVEDVRADVEALGLGAHFGDRIYGSVGDPEMEPKRELLKELMKEVGGEGGRVLVVGDGPVEMRLGRSYGCLTLGVASDEKGGGEIDLDKRRRLIRAGARYVVGDYSELAVIAGLLGMVR